VKNAYNDVLELIGNTPLVRLNHLTKGLKSEVWAKLEYLNPGGSVKDRIGQNIIDDAEEKGLLKPGGTIVEATSGNTGLGLALIAALRGYRCIFVMPDKMSQEKISALRSTGAEVVVTPTAVEPEDPRSYYSVSRRLAEETPNSFYANQYHNPANPESHYKMTGPEIWEQTEGSIDVFVAGMGTGGTLSGLGKYLKEQKPEVKIVGVDPVGSIYYDYWKTGKLTDAYTYKVEGIGEDFIPTTMNLDILDDCVRVNDRECFLITRDLVRREGLHCGGSAGAAVAGALKWVRDNDKEGQRVVVLLPDGSGKYLSKIFNDDWMRENGYLKDLTSRGTVAELLEVKGNRGVVSCSPNDPVSAAVTIMKDLGYSQVPVVDGGEVVGVVHEVTVLDRMLDGSIDSDTPIRDIIERNYTVVDSGTDLPVLSELFTRAKLAVVMGDDGPQDVVTKIDLVDYIARQRR